MWVLVSWVPGGVLVPLGNGVVLSRRCGDVRVHIAKAGGTSLRRLLKLNESVPRFDCFHNGFLLKFEKGRCIGRDRVELSAVQAHEREELF